MAEVKVLVCGLGRVARETLQRLGESWDVTAVEISSDKADALAGEFPNIGDIHVGDASSPVVLEEAGVGGHDYVLALADKDEVNLAVCRFAADAGVRHILARVHNTDRQEQFEELGVKPVMINSQAAKIICHYLEDPRLTATPLVRGRLEVLEVDIPDRHWLVDKKATAVRDPEWWLAAIHRGEEVLYPSRKVTIQAGDRAVIISRPDHFKTISRIFGYGRPGFPSAYGRDLLVGLLKQKDADYSRLLDEAQAFSRNTKVRQMRVLCSSDACAVHDQVEVINQSIDLYLEETEEKLRSRVSDLCHQESIGVLVVPPFEPSFWSAFGRTALIDLAHSLPCPVLVSRGDFPYERILTPFNSTPRAELALETALDLSAQFEAPAAAVIVEEPDFLHGEQGGDWLDQALEHVRNLAHIHKASVEEIVRRGNPVKEVTAEAREKDLLVLGSTTRETGLFSPHVGELIAQRSPCSVLIIAG